jgi:tripartite-type tricarboxylate transporter receptor subunit TctC
MRGFHFNKIDKETDMTTSVKTQTQWGRSWIGALALVAAAISPALAQTSAWPTKPIKLVVCFPPGNAADVFARSVGPLLAERLGQSVVVENRGGAGGVIGVDAVVKSPNDGHTIGVCSLSPITIIPAIRKQMPYDAQQDLAPIILSNRGPMVLVVKKDSPFNTLTDLIQHAKAHPGKLSYASLGPGTISQMSTEAFKMAAGIQLTEVSYKGSSQALTDLVGGHVDVMLDGAASAVTQMAAGTVKALAVTTFKRSIYLPDVPAMNESTLPGLKGFDFFGWVGFFAPAGTPPDVVSRLNKEIAQALKHSQVMQRAQATGQEIVEPNTPEQFRDFMKADAARWYSLARKLNIELKD